MIDLKKYFEVDFKPLDVIGTTSFGVVPRQIWRNTWGRGKRLSLFYPYSKRASNSTHTAITCMGNDGRKWIMEMDNTIPRKRYISESLKKVILPEEYEFVQPSLKKGFKEVTIFSGVKLTYPHAYFTNNIRHAHACWIGRYEEMSDDMAKRGNEWLFDKYREGVPYDYFDILALWKWTKCLKVLGLSTIYICSELVQRCFEHLNIIQYSVAPVTPKQWQENPILKSRAYHNK